MSSDRSVRYAVVGLGHIAQVAVLPAFKHARRSMLAALVSGDPVKRRDLSDIAGTWVEDPEFDKAMAEQDQIDPEMWR